MSLFATSLHLSVLAVQHVHYLRQLLLLDNPKLVLILNLLLLALPLQHVCVCFVEFIALYIIYAILSIFLTYLCSATCSFVFSITLKACIISFFMLRSGSGTPCL